MADAGSLEERTVEVNDPKLSADLNHRLTAAVRDVVGTDRVRVPADRPWVSRGESPHTRPQQRITTLKVAIVGFTAIGALVGLIIAMAYGNWLLTGVTVVVELISLAAVVTSIMGLASVTEYPDPFIVTLLAEQGVHDPEIFFTDLVNEFTPPADGEHRSTAVEDDPAQAAAEQREAVTPAGGASTAVGPGGDA